jgi:hypothetical protein
LSFSRHDTADFVIPALTQTGIASAQAFPHSAAEATTRFIGREQGINAWRAGSNQRSGLLRKVFPILALMALGACSGGVSGDVGRACLSAGRQAASPSLCSCVQRVANQTLTAAEQRRAAGFFSDPDKAQETRRSERAGDKAFWERYRAFSRSAEASCAAR